MKEISVEVTNAAKCSITYQCQPAMLRLSVVHLFHDDVSVSASMHTAPSSVLSPLAMTTQLLHPDHNSSFQSQSVSGCYSLIGHVGSMLRVAKNRKWKYGTLWV